MGIFSKIDLRYALYHFRKSIFRPIIIILLIAGFTAISCINVRYGYYGWDPVNGSTYGDPEYYLDLNVFSVTLMLATIFIPFTEFFEFKNRRNGDTWFSFPISKYKLAFIHFMNGFIDIFLSILISAIIVAVRSSLTPEITFKPIAFTTTMLLALLISFVSYSFISFAFVQGNNIFDGIILSGLYVYFPAIVFDVIDYIIYAYRKDINIYDIGLYDYRPYLSIVSLPERIISRYQQIINWGKNDVEDLLVTPIIIWAIVGILCAIGVVVFFGKNKTYKLGEVSDSPCGYNIMIPAWIYCLQLMSSSGVAGIVFTLIHYGAHVFYRRGVKLTIFDYAKVAVSLVLAIALPIIHKTLT